MTAVGITSKPVANVVRNAKGDKLDVEILLDSESFVRVVGPYVRNLRQIGIDATIRVVDQAQYQRRVKSFDFDLAVQRYALQPTPGPELRAFWGSEAAKTDGSFNLAGISSPAIDALAEKVMAARSREELVAATRAVDRVLRAGHYWVPHWYKAAHNLAFWDKLSWPVTKPKFDRGALNTWWYDEKKAATLGAK
jgi:microcin C transport system substrate-binding protein